MKDLMKTQLFIIFCLLAALTSASSLMAATGCSESTGLRKGYYCQVKTASGEVVKNWWACDSTFLCLEGERHKYYCVDQDAGTGYNQYYYNSGIVSIG